MGIEEYLPEELRSNNNKIASLRKKLNKARKIKQVLPDGCCPSCKEQKPVANFVLLSQNEILCFSCYNVLESREFCLRFLEKHWSEIEKFAYSHACSHGRPEFAGEFLSELTERIVNIVRRFDPQNDSFSLLDWVIYNARFYCDKLITSYRERNLGYRTRHCAESIEDNLSEVESPQECAGLRRLEIAEAVADCMRKLPPEYRRAVKYRIYDRIPVKKCAELEGLTPSGFLARYGKALDEVFRILNPLYGDEMH